MRLGRLDRGPRLRRGGAAAVAAMAIGVALALGCCCGPRNLERYPPKAASPYVLPFEGTRWVCQGNNGFVSHFSNDEFAYDFYMPQGTPVLAARGGVVRSTRNDCDSFGRDAPANFVLVDHGDGTLGYYVHLKKGGAIVVPGERVEARQRIGLSGWTGRAMIPHLHFEVIRDVPGERDTIPVSFADVEGDGIPRAPWLVRPGGR